MADRKHVDISKIIQIGEWLELDEPLAGSRIKNTVAEPKTENLYIFKLPKTGREAQIWSELVASFVAGDLLGWPVQHAQIAMQGEKIGNLLGYIFDPEKDSFYPGEQMCQHVDPEYDLKAGTRHTWALIKDIHDQFIAYGNDGTYREILSSQFNRYWVRTIAFDTLISNTDRHAENWALKIGHDGELMAPFYDNATSLGCEFNDTSLQKKWFNSKGQIIDSKVQSYCLNGCHHLRKNGERYQFEELASVVLNEFPNMRSEYEAIAELNLLPVEQLLNDIMCMKEVPEIAQMTSIRSVQIMTLLREGQARVKRCLEVQV